MLNIDMKPHPLVEGLAPPFLMVASLALSCSLLELLLRVVTYVLETMITLKVIIPMVINPSLKHVIKW
jgi:hypothetical protein